jgi:hypothetical protein
MNLSEAKLIQVQKNLEVCLRELPDQFALAEVRQNLKRTLDSIKNLQKKRVKRKQQEMQNENTKKIGFMSMEDAKRALQILDNMMNDEQKVIDAINNPPQQQQSISDGILFG